jgi:hypothetical protein
VHGVFKIISGGQTGADQGGLIAALELELEVGGTAPKKFHTELGSNFRLRDVYGLVEVTDEQVIEYDGHERTYGPRTLQNVMDSNATALFHRHDTPGTRLTARLCRKHDKPFITINPMQYDESDMARFRVFVDSIGVLNVAGTRESILPGIQEAVRNFIVDAMSQEPSHLSL